MSFPNTLQGDYGAWFQTGAERLYPLGQRMLCPEGRIFRYAENGAAALVACTLVQAEAENAAHDALLVQTATAAGDTHVHFTNNTVDLVENQFQFGYLSSDQAAALGAAHRIAFHAAVLAGAVGTVYFFDGDTMQVNVAITEYVTLRKSMCKDVIVKPASAPTAFVVGVVQNMIAADAYGWVQTHGMAGALTEGSPLVAEKVRPSESVAGAVTDVIYDTAEAELGEVGWMFDSNPASGKNANVFLTLEGAS